MRRVALLLAIACASAYGAQAFLVSSTVGMSVTGQSIWKCVYRYGNQTFVQAIPVASGPCPQMIEVQ